MERLARLRKVLPAVALVAGSVHAAPMEHAGCIESGEFQRLKQHYEDLSARFDLATVTQAVIDLSGETSDLKGQLTACRQSLAATRQDCDAVAARYEAKLGEQASLQNALVAALDMQEYLSTLKLRLERPQCGE